jgi:hypothetical protein
MQGRLLLSLDGLWFRAIEDKFGLEAAIEIDAKAWEGFGRSMARRAMKFLEIKEASVSDVANMVGLFFGGFGVKIETEEKRAVITFTDCPPQKARIRQGLGEFACKPVGIAFFQAFAEVANPQAKIKCLLCPPDEHPQDKWCQWEFAI